MIEDQHLPMNQSAGTSQISLAAAAVGQSSLGSYAWCVDVSVARSPRVHRNSALTVLFSTIKLTCYYECFLFI